jgi:Xaa-Pro aminopeptidase
MIVSNEPGYYRDGAFGIRCENLCVVQEVQDRAQEKPMLCFEALTLVPFDRRLIDRRCSVPAGTGLDRCSYHARVARRLGAAARARTGPGWPRRHGAAVRPENLRPISSPARCRL